MIFQDFKVFTDQIHCLIAFALLEILGNMCIAIICLAGCDATNFEINFLSKFFYKIEKPRQKSNYLENEKNF